MNKVYCPYCGNVMESIHVLQIGGDEADEYYFECDVCAAQSPRANVEEAAYELALRRPPQKPLTLEEVKKQKAIWIEYHPPVNENYRLIPILIEEYDEEYDMYCFYDAENHSARGGNGNEYNKRWRCWATKPSDEEREAAKWD